MDHGFAATGMAAKKQYWLFKSEPEEFSIDDLERDGRTCWDGVRNYQARNFMRDGMRVGDLVLFYHSSTKPVGVAGIARVCKEAYPDHFAWNKKDKHFDPKASPENPIWQMVDIAFVEKFPAVVSLQELRAHEQLDGMMLLQRGTRLSIQPVTAKHFKLIERLGRRAGSLKTT